jgi:Lrp/AsnC family transcriptional regulator, leucine-responsive regulatory protein
VVLDDLDRRILQALQRDGRASHRALASMLGTTTPTVGARIRRLHETGVLAGVTPLLSPHAITGTLWTLLAKAPATLHAAILEALREDADVERVLILSGGRLLILVRSTGPQAIGTLETRLAGLGATTQETWAVTDVALDRQPDLSRHTAVATCAQCRGPIHGPGESGRVDGRRVWFCCTQCKASFLRKHQDMERTATRPPSARGAGAK